MPLLLLPLGAGSGVVPPPAPPIPSSGGDAAALVGDLISFSGDSPRRLYWRESDDPWARIRAWLRRLVRQETPEWHANPELMRIKQDRDVRQVTAVTRISRMTRRKP